MVPISDDPHRWDPGSRLLHESGRNLVVESSHVHRGSRLLVKFEGVDSRTDAERLRGAVYVGPDQLRTLGADQYFHHQLVGCEVVDRAGAELGEVAEVVEGVAHDLLAVSSQGRTHLVPLVKAIILDVDLEAGRVVIDPPAGLFE